MNWDRIRRERGGSLVVPERKPSPMTDRQRTFLIKLYDEAGEPYRTPANKNEASEEISRLVQQKQRESNALGIR